MVPCLQPGGYGSGRSTPSQPLGEPPRWLVRELESLVTGMQAMVHDLPPEAAQVGRDGGSFMKQIADMT